MSEAEWDVVIIGAGPAGALAACLLADKNSKVLLIDKAEFPRGKVCGCCINKSAVTLLQTLKLETILLSAGAVPLNGLTLFENGQTAEVGLIGSYALSRQRLDMDLVNEAVKRGAKFSPATTAEVEATTNGVRKIRITGTMLCVANGLSNDVVSSASGDTSAGASNDVVSSTSGDTSNSASSVAVISTQVVLVADGLNGRALNRCPEFETVVSPASRFGCGTVIDCEDSFFQPGEIYMACADEGYVGAVRIEDGRLDIAAAFDKDFSRAQGNPANAVATIFARNKIPVPKEIFGAQWMGTDTLTRNRSRIAGERIFVIGDACGYAEPFTGEGMAWAMTSAAAVVPYVVKGVQNWDAELTSEWSKAHDRLIRSKQNRSSLIARGLRSNAIRTLAMPIIARFPAAATSIVNHISSPNPR